jgi:hypothetical protein
VEKFGYGGRAGAEDDIFETAYRGRGSRFGIEQQPVLDDQPEPEASAEHQAPDAPQPDTDDTSEEPEASEPYL